MNLQDLLEMPQIYGACSHKFLDRLLTTLKEEGSEEEAKFSVLKVLQVRQDLFYTFYFLTSHYFLTLHLPNLS